MELCRTAALAALLLCAQADASQRPRTNRWLQPSRHLAQPSKAGAVAALRGGGWSAARSMVDDAVEDEAKAASGVGGSEVADDECAATSKPPDGYEVVCKDGVCELKPKAPAATTAPIADAQQPEAAAQANKQQQQKRGDKPLKQQNSNADAKPAAAAKPTPADAATAAAAPMPAQQQEAAAGEPSGDGDQWQELVKMGWDPERAALALSKHKNDIVAAAEALAEEEEGDRERFKDALAALMQHGWDDESALGALRGSEGDVAAAAAALEAEDGAAVEQFEGSVSDMVSSGWDEEVARQALLLQWRKDIERQDRGVDRALKQFQRAGGQLRSAAAPAAAAAGKQGGGKAAQQQQKMVPKHTVVFEATAETLQQLVVDSPVPVLLDVYADWCGPCRQLTPALEEMAMRAGGMFRLVKLDSQAHRQVAEALQVEALPSVFALREGAVVDNFVGGLEPNDMQSFMMGLISGTARPANAPLRQHQLNPQQRQKLTFAMQQLAGLAQLPVARRQRLNAKVDAALSGLLDLGDDATTPAPEPEALAAAKEAARLASTLCANAVHGLSTGELKKFGRISQAGKLYQTVLAGAPAAVAVLHLAGFREKEGEEGYLVLGHRNAAVLTLVQARCDNYVKGLKRFADPKRAAAPPAAPAKQPQAAHKPAPAVKPAVKPADTPVTAAAEAENESEEPEPAAAEVPAPPTAAAVAAERAVAPPAKAAPAPKQAPAKPAAAPAADAPPAAAAKAPAAAPKAPAAVAAADDGITIKVDGVQGAGGTGLSLQGLAADTTLEEVFAAVGDASVVALAARVPKGTFTRAEDGQRTLKEVGFEGSVRLRALKGAGGGAAAAPTTAAAASSGSEPKAAPKKQGPKRGSAPVTATPRSKKAAPAGGGGKRKGSLYGAGGIMTGKDKKYEEHFGGDTTVTLAQQDSDPEESEEEAVAPVRLTLKRSSKRRPTDSDEDSESSDAGDSSSVDASE